MNNTIETTDQTAEFVEVLRSGVRGLGGIGAVRDTLDDLTGIRAAHRQMMDELGLDALLIHEDLGGLDFTLTTAASIGRAAGAVPMSDLVGPYVMAPTILTKLHSVHPDAHIRSRATDILRGIADGTVSVTASLDGIVFDAEAAEHIIFYQDGVLQLTTISDIELHPLSAFDPTRTLHRITPTSTRGDTLATGKLASKAATAGLTAGRTYLAAELEGTAHAMLEQTVEFLRERVAFGRPLGSFQALKHQVADLWSELSLISPLVDEAARIFDEDDTSQEATIYAAAALSFAADTALKVCERGLQLHGGTGYTWESPVHIWLKRAAANRVRLGTPHNLRAEIATLTDI